MKVYRCDARILAPVEQVGGLISALEPTETSAWIGRVQYARATVRGIPAKRLDVLIGGALADLAVDGEVLIEGGIKRGRYDHSARPRVTIRRPPPGLGVLPGTLSVSLGRTVEIVLTPDVGSAWSTGEIDRLRWELDPIGGLEHIAGWHLSRWYRHIADDVAATTVAAEIEAETPTWRGMTLAEANRLVSRHLYRTSRDLGWRKLTKRERDRLGLSSEAQWMRQEEIDRLVYHRTGCGDYTHAISRGEEA